MDYCCSFDSLGQYRFLLIHYAIHYAAQKGAFRGIFAAPKSPLLSYMCAR